MGYELCVSIIKYGREDGDLCNYINLVWIIIKKLVLYLMCAVYFSLGAFSGSEVFLFLFSVSGARF
jgi:hypothetical protein